MKRQSLKLLPLWKLTPSCKGSNAMSDYVIETAKGKVGSYLWFGNPLPDYF